MERKDMRFWEKIGSTIKNFDPNHLMTFHPRGRTSSTDWFHQSLWLDFNMFRVDIKEVMRRILLPKKEDISGKTTAQNMWRRIM